MAETKKVADAYIDPDDRILDPELLDKSILDRMPQPTGWRMLVLPYAGKTKTKGGMLLKWAHNVITIRHDMVTSRGAKKNNGF